MVILFQISYFTTIQIKLILYPGQIVHFQASHGPFQPHIFRQIPCPQGNSCDISHHSKALTAFQSTFSSSELPYILSQQFRQIPCPYGPFQANSLPSRPISGKFKALAAVTFRYLLGHPKPCNISATFVASPELPYIPGITLLKIPYFLALLLFKVSDNVLETLEPTGSLPNALDLPYSVGPTHDC